MAYLAIISSLLLLISSSQCSSSSNIVVVSEPIGRFDSEKIVTQKVNLSLYYETLCPYCEDFISNSIADAVNSDLMSIINLQLFPWGNAHLQPNNSVTCQHGEEECYLNTIHACVINIWPDVMTHFSLIKCMEAQALQLSVVSRVYAEKSWHVCADKLELSSQSIKQCYDSGRGKQLLLQFGNLTNQLKPAHQYVPWVVVNGKPLYEDLENFISYVCKAYKGKPLPKSCQTHQMSHGQNHPVKVTRVDGTEGFSQANMEINKDP